MYGPSPQPPKRKGLSGWAIAGIVVGAIVAVCMIGGLIVALANPEDEPQTSANNEPPAAADPGESATPDPDEPAAEDEAEPAGIGDAVRDGVFEFVVTEVETGVESVGDEFLGKQAQGQFVLVHVSVENIGEEAQYFDSSSQYLIDSEEREHSADGEAAIYIENSESFLNEINPGNRVDAIVVFDIPSDAAPTTMRLHDSPFSGGVEVNVSET